MFTNAWDATDFTRLRDLVCGRLTLFNARRGGEPARMSIENWEAAERGVWLDNERAAKMPPEDQKLFGEMKIAYQSGKGVNHLVSILFRKIQFTGCVYLVTNKFVPMRVCWKQIIICFLVLKDPKIMLLAGMQCQECAKKRAVRIQIG